MQWVFSDPTNNLLKDEIKRGEDPFNTSFNSVPINLFGRLFLIGWKEMAWWLSESEGVLEAEARMITATREIEKS